MDQYPNHKGRSRDRLNVPAVALLVSLVLATPGAEADPQPTSPPMQHEACLEGRAPLVKEVIRQTGLGWVRLYQDHSDGMVYISWELHPDVEHQDSSLEVFDQETQQEGAEHLFEEPSGYCAAIDSVPMEFYYRYLFDYDTFGQGGGGRAYAVCSPPQHSLGLRGGGCVWGPDAFEGMTVEMLCGTLPEVHRCVAPRFLTEGS